MKLSEAMMLGDTLRERDGRLYLIVTSDKACGCAIGGAYLALGKARVDPDMVEFPWLLEQTPLGSWLARVGCGMTDISFDRVMAGEFTFEQMVDWVRSIEPSCGDCNRFDCICVSDENGQSLIFESRKLAREYLKHYYYQSLHIEKVEVR